MWDHHVPTGKNGHEDACGSTRRDDGSTPRRFYRSGCVRRVVVTSWAAGGGPFPTRPDHFPLSSVSLASGAVPSLRAATRMPAAAHDETTARRLDVFKVRLCSSCRRDVVSGRRRTVSNSQRQPLIGLGVLACGGVPSVRAVTRVPAAAHDETTARRLDVFIRSGCVRRVVVTS